MEGNLRYSDTGGSEVDLEVFSESDQEVLREQVKENESRSEKRVRGDSEEIIDDGFTQVVRKPKRSKLKTPDQVEEQEKFVVVITSQEVLPKQFGMAKLLRSENIQNILKIVYKNPYKALIEFEKKSDAEGLINCETISSKGLKCQMMNEINVSYGLVRQVDLDIEEKEALENLKFEFDILAVRRLKRLNEDGKWVDCETIRLSIKGSTLPPYVYGYGCRFKVEPYRFPVTQCSSCWKFGHLIRTCSVNKTICPKCAGEHQNCESVHFKCANCNGPHMALSRTCPVYLREKEIREIMSAENCTFRKALSLFLDKKAIPGAAEKASSGNYGGKERQTYINRTLQPTLSYRNALVTNAVVHREEIDSEEEVNKSEKEVTYELSVAQKTGRKQRRVLRNVIVFQRCHK